MLDKRIKLRKGDITEMKVDAVVNAANSSLMGGGGVDGAIHRKGGRTILEECIRIREKQGDLAPGEAVITTAGKLPARHVIHTVGPVWHGGKSNEEELLANAYRNSLAVAVKNKARTIVFPNISTGVYRFPKSKAAEIALSTVNKFLEDNKDIEEVMFICFDEENYSIYEKMIQ